MAIEKLTQLTGEQAASEIMDELSVKLGAVTDLEVATGGLVHHVFRVRSESDSSYLKIRGSFYSEIPNIETQPELIDHERRAIDLFNVETPEYFPSVLAYNPDHHYLLLDDVMPGGTTLDKKYEQGMVTMDDLHALGGALGDIHARNVSTTESVRHPDDVAYQARLLQYGLEFYKHPALLKASNEHQQRQTQLIVGDLSPKNAYVENGVIRLCDLENAHQGALAYDQAFALAHVVLHQETESEAIEAMRAYLDGYRESNPTAEQTDDLVAITLHGLLLYRLDNPVIPYELPFSAERKEQMARNVFDSLDNESLDPEEIVRNLFKD